MNEFYEALSNYLEELRCDSADREYAVAPEDVKEAETELRKMQKKFMLRLEKMPAADKIFLEEYLEVLEHAHFKEEQRSYYQGMVDGAQMLGGLGLIKKGKNIKKLVEKLKE